MKVQRTVHTKMERSWMTADSARWEAAAATVAGVRVARSSLTATGMAAAAAVEEAGPEAAAQGSRLVVEQDSRKLEASWKAAGRSAAHHIASRTLSGWTGSEVNRREMTND